MQSRPLIPDLNRLLTTGKLELLVQIASTSENAALKCHQRFMGNPNIGLLFSRNTLEQYKESRRAAPTSEILRSSL